MSTKDKPCPTWEQNVQKLMLEPYWIPEERRKKTGQHWVDMMKEWGYHAWDLSKYEDVKVKERAISIYRHLRSKSMPITGNPDDYWPDDALETFRIWVNGGFPLNSDSQVTPKELIPTPVDPRPEFKIRRDIMSLSKEELAEYQSKLEEVLCVGELDSKWQELGALHADWCLHYQEATFLWHRAYLRYVEELIGVGIPYWNGYGVDCTNPDSEFAGVPSVFFEEEYISPKDGTRHKNPLKYALAFQGQSKDKSGRYITRYPYVEQRNASSDWEYKIKLFHIYHGQIMHALLQNTYSSFPQKNGYPWANIADFKDLNEDTLYPPHRLDFDGLFEQVHDNFHGWVGPDMADNTYTGFDPIFLSYHANMDRLAGMFMEAHPTNQYSSNFPLQPFVDNATGLAYDNPCRWAFTTIGDMAKDTRALGYVYADPVSKDVYKLPMTKQRTARTLQPNGGRAITLLSNGSTNGALAASEHSTLIPFIVFSGVGCTDSSYRIDVFTAQAGSLVADPVNNPDYIGQITRIGMGPGTGEAGRPSTRRCRKPKASRVLNAEKVANKLSGETSGSTNVKLVVTNIETGELVAEDEYKKLPGFEAKIMWLPRSTEAS